MIVLRLPAWLAATNAYIIARGKGSPAVVIDAPPEPDLVSSAFLEHDLTLAGLLLTHGHIDHTGGSGQLVEGTRAHAYVHPDDDFLTLHPEEQLRQMLGMVPPGSYEPPSHLERIGHGDVLEIAGFRLEVRHTPGHTPGHCCFYMEGDETLFSGDQLFAGSIGRTDFSYGDMGQLADSMRTQVMTLPDETRVLPGHGPETSIGVERSTNPFRELWETGTREWPV